MTGVAASVGRRPTRARTPVSDAALRRVCVYGAPMSPQRAIARPAHAAASTHDIGSRGGMQRLNAADVQNTQTARPPVHRKLGDLHAGALQSAPPEYMSRVPSTPKWA